MCPNGYMGMSEKEKDAIFKNLGYGSSSSSPKQDTDFTEKDKEILTSAMGEGMGKAFKDVMEEVEKKSRETKIISEQRWDTSIRNFTRIETKIDQIIKLLESRK